MLLLVSSNSRHAQTIDCSREGRGIFCRERGLNPVPRDENLSPYCTVNKDLKQLNTCVSFCFA